MARISRTLRLALVTTAGLALAAPASAIDQAHRDRARDMIEKAATYLISQQDASGGWAVPPPGTNSPTLPAITGLALNALALHPADDDHEANAARAQAAAHAVDFLLSKVQADGGIYDQILPSYNTAICISALSRYRGHDDRIDPVLADAVAMLRSLQWGEDAGVANPDGSESAASQTVHVVGPDHPFYGGIGYGRHGRPDNSNLNFALDALHDAGVDRDDPAFQRALVFLRRTQMHEAVNDAPYARGSRQGGFIYATAESGDDPGVGQSEAGSFEESMDDGSRVSRLRAYGSMTYAGFKSMIYAGLSQDDLRVRLALEWIKKNYTVAENPGIGAAGTYYYYLTFARALDAAEIQSIAVQVAPDPNAPPALPTRRPQADGTIVEFSGGGTVTIDHDWANDLIDQLASLQNDDGSFKSVDARWMEDNTVLITAYATIALEHAAGFAD